MKDHSREIPRARLWNRILFLTCHSLPVYLEGLFLRSPFWTRVFDNVMPIPIAATLLQRMKRSDQVGMLDFGWGRNLRIVILKSELIEHVLCRSPFCYVDPTAKRRGMQHFQPEAVAIARGSDWQRKRTVNESMLSQNHFANLLEPFRMIVERECRRSLEQSGSRLTWPVLSQLFGVVSRQIILGPAARDDEQITRTLRRLMRQSNRLLWLRRGSLFVGFQRALDRYVNRAQEGGLLGSPEAQIMGDRLSGQIAHWMFAMNDTLAENTARALWLVQGLSGDERNKLSESVWCQKCLLEAMRLYPTTPILSRVARIADNLNDVILPEGAQVLVLNTIWHRDPDNYGEPHRFQPRRWDDPDTPQGYFLGGGRQRCAGEALALWLGGEIIRTLVPRLSVSDAAKLSSDLPWRLNVYRLNWIINESSRREFLN